MLKSYLIVFFISMLPLIELRGAIPVGIGMGLPILPTYLVCVEIGRASCRERV